MSAYAAPAPAVEPSDRLAMTLFFTVCAHLLVVLGVGFAQQERPRSSANSLDIVLVQRKSEQAPDEAEFIGQANQEGGGESDTPERPSTPLPSPLLSNAPDVAAASPPVPPSEPVASRAADAPEPEQAPPPPQSAPQPIVAAPESPSPDRVAAVDPPAPDAPEADPVTREPEPVPEPAEAPPEKPVEKAEVAQPQPSPKAESNPVQSIDAATLVRRSLAMASLSAEVNRRMDAYAKRPRRKWISARTREHKYAAYMEAWRAKVERIGNLNYPDEARRRRLSGNLLLDVALNADGSVREIRIRRSSGEKVLDDAAMRIVRLAAPFAKFPKNIREETDILHIQRTWRFLTDNRFASR